MIVVIFGGPTNPPAFLPLISLPSDLDLRRCTIDHGHARHPNTPLDLTAPGLELRSPSATLSSGRQVNVNAFGLCED